MFVAASIHIHPQTKYHESPEAKSIVFQFSPFFFDFFLFIAKGHKTQVTHAHTHAHTHTHCRKIRDIGAASIDFEIQHSSPVTPRTESSWQTITRERKGSINILTILTDLAGSRGWWSVDCRLVGERGSSRAVRGLWDFVRLGPIGRR